MAGELAERLMQMTPFVLAVHGLDFTFSASLLFHELCCKVHLSFRPDGWRTQRALAAARRSQSPSSKAASHRDLQAQMLLGPFDATFVLHYAFLI